MALISAFKQSEFLQAYPMHVLRQLIIALLPTGASTKQTIICYLQTKNWPANACIWIHQLALRMKNALSRKTVKKNIYTHTHTHTHQVHVSSTASPREHIYCNPQRARENISTAIGNKDMGKTVSTINSTKCKHSFHIIYFCH